MSNISILDEKTIEVLTDRFTLTDIKSPFFGKFDIYLNDEKTIIYKKIKGNFLSEENLEFYKKTLTSAPLNLQFGSYFLPIYRIEDDKSYYSKFLSNGVRLDNILEIINDYPLPDLKNILDKWYDLMSKLKNSLDKNELIMGDWGSHNLIYCFDDKKIYNVDAEGCYTCKISNISFDNLMTQLTKYKKKLMSIDESTKKKVINLLKYTKSNGKAYSGYTTDIGYHSIQIGNTYHTGQRGCDERLNFFRKEFDFKGANLLDIGCCQGGMIYPLIKDGLKSGIGIDYDPRNINSCNSKK